MDDRSRRASPDSSGVAPHMLAGASRIVGDEVLGDPVTEWRVHRVTWISLVVIVCLASVGFAGDGIASRRTVTTRSGLTVAYSAVLRLSNSSTFIIRGLPRRRGTSSLLAGSPGDAWYDPISIEPQPQNATMTDSGVRFTMSDSATDHSVVRLMLVPRDAGVHRLRIGSENGAADEIRVLVLP